MDYLFDRMGDYKLIQGSPGKYNNWYQLPTGADTCGPSLYDNQGYVRFP
jgi:hypothetical protein